MMKYVFVVLLAIAAVHAEEIKDSVAGEEPKFEEMKAEDTIALVKSWPFGEARYSPLGLRVVPAVEPLSYISPKFTTVDTVKYEPVKVGAIESDHLAYEHIQPYGRYISYRSYPSVVPYNSYPYNSYPYNSYPYNSYYY